MGVLYLQDKQVHARHPHQNNQLTSNVTPIMVQDI